MTDDMESSKAAEVFPVEVSAAHSDADSERKVVLVSIAPMNSPSDLLNFAFAVGHALELVGAMIIAMVQMGYRDSVQTALKISLADAVLPPPPARPQMDELLFGVLRHDEDGNTIAMVSCKRTEQVLTPRDVLKKLRAGLTKWMKETPEGRKALLRSDNDFNVGDLSFELGPEMNSVRTYLIEAGLHNLDVEVLHHDNESVDWTYDTLLFDTLLGE